MDANGKIMEVPPQNYVKTQPTPRKYTLVYLNIFVILYWHIAALYGLYMCFTSAKWTTNIFNAALYVCAMLGITAGAHRLWSHRTYKAKLPLQIMLMLFHSMSYQFTVFKWARDHRAHHKFCETDADPHNPRRGFFFAHFGWLLVRKTPEAIEKGKTIDMSDIYENPVLQFQHKHWYINEILTFVVPTLVPIFCWQETLNIAYHIVILRHVCAMNAIMFTNSAAHAYGFKPYNKHVSATQSPVLSITTLGETFHNYHHVFPFDYRSAELGNNYINMTTKFIDFFALIGWAYDRKYATDDMIAKRGEKTGDGTDLWGRVKEVKRSKKTEEATDRDDVDDTEILKSQ